MRMLEGRFSGAKIAIIEEEGNLCADRGQAPFDLVANEHGIATRLRKNCMCFGTKGMGKDTFAIHIPGWHVQVSAPGYSLPEPFFLDTRENQQRVQRGGDVAS